MGRPENPRLCDHAQQQKDQKADEEHAGRQRRFRLFVRLHQQFLAFIQQNVFVELLLYGAPQAADLEKFSPPSPRSEGRGWGLGA
jgi:hypothetical protein